MELGTDLIKMKFDDIDAKIDFVIELCQELQSENNELLVKIKQLEIELDAKTESEKSYSERDGLVQSKIDGLLKKLDDFTNNGHKK